MSISQAEQKKARSLQSRKGRTAYQLFVAEGVRLLEEAARFGHRPHTLYVAESLLTDRAQVLLDKFRAADTPIIPGSAAQLKRMTAAESSQGLLALFDLPATDLAELSRPSERKVLVCENLSDPGNVGTLIRTSLAFGFSQIILCGQTAEPWAPKVVRSSVGAIFGTEIGTGSSDEAVEYLTSENIPLLAAALAGSVGMTKALDDIPGPNLALAIGSEAEGLTDAILDRATAVVRIDHRTEVESLNSAVAGAILMKDCFDWINRRKK